MRSQNVNSYMKQNYPPESFKKGEQFEQFVEKSIFTDDHYELITRTNSFEQNANRFAEDTLKPDFKFRCKVTGQEFWVEAKYRSELPNDQIEALSFSQRDRFYLLEKEEGIPVFVIIGYWGSASKPYALSLIPLKDYEYINIYRSFLRRYDLPIQSISNKRMGFTKQEEKETERRSKQDQAHSQEEKKPETKDGLKKYNSQLLGFAAVGIVAIIMTIYSFVLPAETPVSTPEDELKEIITDYYQAMNSNQIEKLPEFLSPQVTSWYGEQNPSREWIYRNARIHRGNYPYSSSDIDWESFTVIPEEAGGYHVTYEMIYRSKEKITDDYTVYDLKMITKWDENFKLRGITEVRN